MEQVELLKYVLGTLDRMNLEYMVVGSFASTTYGEPRFTQDIDIVIQIPPGKIKMLCEAFQMPEFYLSHEAAFTAVAQCGQFNVIHPTSGNKVDFIISRDDEWGIAQLARRRRVHILPDCAGFVASPEDVILGKLIYYEEGGSEKRIRDISGIMKITGATLDSNYIQIWATKLGVLGNWQMITSEQK